MTTKKETRTETKETVIIARGLVKKFEDVVAVAGVDLTVRGGECFGLLGPNGAGKTTTVEILEGLTTADAGEVRVLNMTWTGKNQRAIRQRIGVQLQDNQMAEKLTVREVLTLFRSFYDRCLTVDESLASVDLASKQNTRYHKLSGGQKQRLSLAAALINKPDLLFLDEPTTGLDPQARAQVWEMINQFKSDGGTVLITTHYMEEAEKLCDRLAIMDNGRVIVEGTPADLIAALHAEQIVNIVLKGTIELENLESLPSVTRVVPRNGITALHVRTISDTLPALFETAAKANVTIETLRTHQASLDDVFLAHTGRALRDA
jgi:ABC-2 type transport system ATP-binding protein